MTGVGGSTGGVGFSPDKQQKYLFIAASILVGCDGVRLGFGEVLLAELDCRPRRQKAP